MKSFPTDAKKIKITFVCDLCGVDVEYETEVPTEQVTVGAVCSICHKGFPVKITSTGIEVSDIADDDVAIEVV